MNYETIYNDPFLKEQLEIIDHKNDNYKNHGLRHALNVVSNIEKLSEVLKLSKEELKYLKIAGYMHDIGRVAGTVENHDIKGMEFTSGYLATKIEKIWLDKILLALKNHHEKQDLDKLSIFEHIVLFADKMDFSKERIEQKYKVEGEESPYFESNISSIDFVIEENTFIVAIKLINNKNKDDFANWEASLKIIKRIKEFADKLDMDYKINFK